MMFHELDVESVVALTKPYYPPFPEKKEYQDLIPGCINRHDMKGCFCPSCVPALWAKLSPHPIEPDVLDAQGKVIKRSKVDARQIVDFFSSHVSRLLSGNLSALELHLVDGIREYVDGLINAFKNDQHIKDPGLMPQLADIGEELNQFLFAGHVGGVKYEWVKPMSLDKASKMPNSTIGWSLDYKDHIQMNRTVYWGTGVFARHTKDQLVERLVGTLIHEMCHVLFDRYLCEGQCDDCNRPEMSMDQRQLCGYLSARMYRMYSAINIDGRVAYPRTLLHGHGVAFTQLTSMFSKVMTKLLNMERRMTLQYVAPECGDGCRSACWSHCYHDDDKLLRLHLNDIKANGERK